MNIPLFPIRSSLYSAIAHQPLHSLIAAQISGPSPEGAEGMGIKVATFPGEVMGCVIVQLEEHLDSTELLAGDRFAVISLMCLVHTSKTTTK